MLQKSRKSIINSECQISLQDVFFLSRTKQYSWSFMQLKIINLEKMSYGYVNGSASYEGSKNDIKPDQSVKITESISNLSWMNNNTDKDCYFSSVGWDSSLRIYEIKQAQFGSIFTQKCLKNVNVPILCSCWAPDNSKIFLGCIDGTIKAVDTTTMNSTDIGKHDSAVSALNFIPEKNTIISTSYQNSIHFWQINNPNPVYKLDAGSKVFAADYKNNTFVAGTAGEKLLFFDVGNFGKKNIVDCQLGKFSQIQSASLNQTGDILGVTSCDGRANVSIIDKNHYKLSSVISFKSNKQEEGNIVVLYPVNTCGFNSNIENWFMTAGSDGVMSFWDLKEKSKIKSLTYNSTPICDAKVSPSGKTVVYALGNDWHIGAEGVGKWETKIGVHVITGQQKKSLGFPK